MTLETYLKHLQKLIADNPQIKNYTVVYCVDDEGNGFDTVKYGASIVASKDIQDLVNHNQNLEEIVICIN